MPRGCPGAAGHRCNWLMHKSSSSLVLRKACSIKLYSSAAFLILWPQDLQTRSERFSSLVSGNTIEPQQSDQLKSARHILLCPMAKIFQMTLFSPGVVNFTRQNSAAAVFLNLSIFGFLGYCWHYTDWRFSHKMLAAMNIFSRLPAWSQSCRIARALFWLVIELTVSFLGAFSSFWLWACTLKQLGAFFL